MFALQNSAQKQAEEIVRRKEAAKRRLQHHQGGSRSTASFASGTSSQHSHGSVNKTRGNRGASKSRNSSSTCCDIDRDNRSIASDITKDSDKQTRKVQRNGLFGRRSQTDASTGDRKQGHGKKQEGSHSNEGEVPMVVSTPHTSTKTTSKEQLRYEEKKKNAIETIKRLEQTIDTQEKREAALHVKIQSSVKKAKDMMAMGNKSGALRWMKQKKRDENEKAEVNAVIDTIMSQVDSIESTLNQAECLADMRSAAATMEDLRSSTSQGSLEQVDLLMEKIRDSEDYAAEVTRILSEPVHHVVMSDEDLLNELEELQEGEVSNMDMEVETPHFDEEQMDYLSSIPQAPHGFASRNPALVPEDN